VAGFVLEDDRLTACAPILRKVISGKTPDQMRAAFAAMGWKASIVTPSPPA